jgi:hypothetical protein
VSRYFADEPAGAAPIGTFDVQSQLPWSVEELAEYEAQREQRKSESLAAQEARHAEEYKAISREGGRRLVTAPEQF